MKPVTTGAAAAKVGVDAATIRRWARQGYIRAQETPTGRLLIDPSSLETVLRPVGATEKGQEG